MLINETFTLLESRKALRDEYPMRKLHLCRKRSLDSEQRVRLSSLGERITPDVISRDSCSEPIGFDSERYHDIAWQYLTRNINSSFYAEAANAFLPRPVVPGFLWPRPQISRFGKEPLLSFTGFQEEETRGGGGPQHRRRSFAAKEQRANNAGCDFVFFATSCRDRNLFGAGRVIIRLPREILLNLENPGIARGRVQDLKINRDKPFAKLVLRHTAP